MDQSASLTYLQGRDAVRRGHLLSQRSGARRLGAGRGRGRGPARGRGPGGGAAAEPLPESWLGRVGGFIQVGWKGGELQGH